MLEQQTLPVEYKETQVDLPLHDHGGGKRSITVWKELAGRKFSGASRQLSLSWINCCRIMHEEVLMDEL